MRLKYLTSESVCMGHPDKMCDRISDAILDACLQKDPYARVAVESMVSSGAVFVAGQLTANGEVNVEQVIKNTIRDIGYDAADKGMDYKSSMIFKNINEQSADIALGVNANDGKVRAGQSDLGSGDQGIMYGYATDETPAFLPLPFYLATELVKRLDACRKNGTFSWLYPDGKAQVTVAYDERKRVDHIHSVIVSCQHDTSVSQQQLQESILREVILPIIDTRYISRETKIHINPTGAFHIGGPEGDTGLTGRKLMVDTYGGLAKHGGGAFSGKDATKLDRSGAYMARYVAKNIVAAGLAKCCEVSVSYCIGCREPEAVDVDTFGTGCVPDERIAEAVKEIFPFSVADIIQNLELRKPIFEQTACYGHFGDPCDAWERTDKVNQLRKRVLEQKVR